MDSSEAAETGHEMVNQNPAPESSNYFHPVLLRKCVCERLQEPSIFLTVCRLSFCALIWETILGLPFAAKLPHCIFTDLQKEPRDPVPHFLICLCSCFCIFLGLPSLPQSVLHDSVSCLSFACPADGSLLESHKGAEVSVAYNRHINPIAPILAASLLALPAEWYNTNY